MKAWSRGGKGDDLDDGGEALVGACGEYIEGGEEVVVAEAFRVELVMNLLQSSDRRVNLVLLVHQEPDKILLILSTGAPATQGRTTHQTFLHRLRVARPLGDRVQLDDLLLRRDDKVCEGALARDVGHAGESGARG